MHYAKSVLTPEPHLGIILLVVLALLAPAAVVIVAFALPSSPPNSSEKSQSPNHPGGEHKKPPYFQGPLLYGQQDRSAFHPSPPKYLPTVAPGSRLKSNPAHVLPTEPNPVPLPIFVRSGPNLTAQ
jgi:hypothetical protein